MNRTYSELQQTLLSLGYQWKENNLELNFIWERTSDIITNIFSDFLHVAYVEDGVQNVITIPATTKPGLKGSVMEPVTVNGITGTSVIIPGQYIDAWEFHDTFKEFSEYPYFKQVGPVDYWRDNRDTNIADDQVQKQEQDNQVHETHWHRMSQTGTYGSGQVNNWSLGCMGSPEPQWKKILDAVRRSVAIYGNKATGTIILTEDFS
jgi:hypothetical protein